LHFPPPPNPHRRPGIARYVEPPKPAPRRWGIRLGITSGIVALVGVTAFAADARYFPVTAVLPGLAIDGERVPDGAAAPGVRALVEARAKALGARPLRLMMPGSDRPVLETSLKELGVVVDVDETIAVATRVGKSGDVLGRAEAAHAAREGKIDVPLVASIDRAVALQVIERAKEKEDTSPISARLDLDKHATIPGKEGRYIDADGAVIAVEAALRDRRTEAITVPVASFAPRISAAYLASLDISTVVAEYETYFGRRGDQERRGKNIDNAAQKLDGLVISPGEMISFNDVIGERSEANGFHKSWEIFKGEMVEGLGGGTCQVASTFHAAIFFAGFDVLERLPHSRPSAYIPMGLDSTVVFPAVDLKVRNPHPFPIVVHAKTDGPKLRVELLGKERPVKVGFGREVLETIPYKRKILEEPTLAAGKKVRVKQHGINGYTIKRTRIFTYANGATRKEEKEDKYPATTEIYEVPVGFDVSLLPPLPSGSGSGEDSDLGGNPGPAPPEAATPTRPGVTPTAEITDPPSVEMIDAPGAHAPTAAQKEPPKTIWLRR
jgi:vancomycin resistance protein YoaR